VDDHSGGVDAIVSKGKVGETYCLGGNAEMSNIDLTKTLIKLLGKDESSIEFVKDRPGHDRRYAVDYSKAERELGWEPKVTFEEGLKRTIEWYKDNQDWVERCKSGDYQKYYDEWYNKELKIKNEEL
jgi:dTDP-glucose 4,6-dehydratase